VSTAVWRWDDVLVPTGGGVAYR